MLSCHHLSFKQSSVPAIAVSLLCISCFCVPLLHAFGVLSPCNRSHGTTRDVGLSMSSAIPRNQFIGVLGSSAAASLVFPRSNLAIEDDSGSYAESLKKYGQQDVVRSNTDPIAYAVQADSTIKLSPELHEVSANDLIKRVSLGTTNQSKEPRQGALWIGEHHNALVDHNLQASLIQQIHDTRRKASRGERVNMAIGLEQVQVQFQSVLDDYIAGRLSEDELKKGVQWGKRWVWSFEGYQPVFEKAKKLGIPLLALNVDSEDLADVEVGGYPNLARPKLKKYITDPYGFADFSAHEDYRTYVNYVIEPSYDLHERLGLLKYTISGQKLEDNMTFRNFLSGRTLWDEGMASAAIRWNQANPGGLLVGLVGADHVKYGKGITGRYERMAAKAATKSASEGNSSTSKTNNTVDLLLSCTSLILNPTLVDTRPSGSLLNVDGAGRSDAPDTITLQLRYLKDGVNRNSAEERRLPESTGGVLPFSDYILIGGGTA